MRYRVKDYSIHAIAGTTFAVQIPTVPVTLPEDATAAEAVVRQAIRLVVDETAKVVYCSSMQKDSRLSHIAFGITGGGVGLVFIGVEGKISGIESHEFTIEFDWGDTPYEHDTDLSSVAKQGSNSNATNTAILNRINYHGEIIESRFGDGIIADLNLPYLPACKYYNSYFQVDNAGVISSMTAPQKELKVGMIVRTYNAQGHYYVNSATDPWTYAEEESVYLDGITKDSTFNNYYYVVSEIVSMIGGEVYVFEEYGDEATITDLIKQAIEKIKSSQSGDPLLEAFFGLPSALPEYTAMTDSQIKQICDEDWVALYGYLTVEVTMHFLDANNQDQTVHIYVRPDQTYAAQGWSNLYTAYTGGSSLDQTQPTANQTVYFVR